MGVHLEVEDMDALLFVGDIRCVKPEIIGKLERYGLELMHFASISEIMPYLNEDIAKMVMIHVDFDDDHQQLRADIEKLNRYSKGKVPLVLATTDDNLSLRQKYLDLSYVHFFQYNAERPVLRKNFEALLTELMYREQMKNLKFAVLDDDKLQLHALHMLFEKHGIKDVKFFSHPDEFEASEEEFDVYLIDLVMPKKMGDEIIFEIRKKYSDAVILAVSSLETTDVIAKVLSLGANDFIVKPYNETIFMAKIMSSSRLGYLLKENRRKTSELEEIVVRDPMTNLYNYRQIEQTLSELTYKYREAATPFSVIMLDIDHFKQINDTHGHIVGDKMLVGIAETMKSVVGDKGIIGRYGGEEFIVILPGIVEAEAFFVGERIRRLVENQELFEGVKVTISMGVAECDSSCESIIERADALLYEAKKLGRNRVISSTHIA